MGVGTTLTTTYDLYLTSTTGSDLYDFLTTFP